jgi:hypothetical protein
VAPPLPSDKPPEPGDPPLALLDPPEPVALEASTEVEPPSPPVGPRMLLLLDSPHPTPARQTASSTLGELQPNLPSRNHACIDFAKLTARA